MVTNEFCCSSCQNEIPYKKIEEKKEEETLCYYCLKRNNKTPCIILFQGKASCLACKNDERNKTQPIFNPESPQNKIKNHHKTSSDKTSLIETQNKKGNITAREKIASSDARFDKQLSSPQSDREFLKRVSNFEKNNFTYNNNNHSMENLLKQINLSHTQGGSNSPSTFKKVVSLVEDMNSKLSSNELFQKEKRLKNLKEFLENIAIMGVAKSTSENKIYSLKQFEDPHASKEFHKVCDDKDRLVFGIILNSGFIFGCYIVSPLLNDTNNHTDSEAQIFSIFGEKYYFYSISNDFIKYEKKGFSFGNPCDLLINLDSIDESVCNMTLKYKTPLGGEIKFKIAQNFVWSLMVSEIFVCLLK